MQEARADAGRAGCRRRDLWAREQAAKEAAGAARDAHAAARRAFGHAVAPDLFRGLESLKAIVAECGIKGVRGPLIDLIACKSDKYANAVEVRLTLTPNMCTCRRACCCLLTTTVNVQCAPDRSYPAVGASTAQVPVLLLADVHS